MLGMHLPMLQPLSSTVAMAENYDSDCFQMFTRSTRGLGRRYISQNELDDFNRALILSKVKAVVVHASFCMNPATSDEGKRKSYLGVIEQDLQLCYQFAVNKVYYVIHPGSATDCSREGALYHFRNLIHYVAKKYEHVVICPEYMSGAGNQLLCTVDECKYILDDNISNLKLCLDTCHMFASPDDINYAFESLIDHAGVIHMNNSQHAKHSRKDRHASLQGGGVMDDNYLKTVYSRYSNAFKDLPIILETPTDTMVDDYFVLKNFKQ